MGKLMIVNGSPRAPKSNSKIYVEIFKKYWKEDVLEYSVTAKKHAEACALVGGADEVLFSFPLYADGLPVTLMRFLKELEDFAPGNKKVHALINCGFYEPEQNQVALDMLKEFCRRNGMTFCSSLCIGSGEALPTTPFMFFVRRKMKKLVRAIKVGRVKELKMTMPLTKKAFLRASTKFWTRYGEKNGITAEQMDTMLIEGE